MCETRGRLQTGDEAQEKSKVFFTGENCASMHVEAVDGSSKTRCRDGTWNGREAT